MLISVMHMLRYSFFLTGSEYGSLCVVLSSLDAPDSSCACLVESLAQFMPSCCYFWELVLDALLPKWFM
jgi:hypothetical protein